MKYLVTFEILILAIAVICGFVVLAMAGHFFMAFLLIVCMPTLKFRGGDDGK